MALPTILAAYNDCIDIFDAVHTKRSPARVEFATQPEAHIFQLRMQNARVLTRKESTRLYAPDDPRYNHCEYDYLVVRKPIEDTAGHWWVYIEAHGSNILTVEMLEPSPNPTLIEYTPEASDAN